MTILITGGSKGIGRATAERFAADGDRVLICYGHDDEAAADTGRAVERAGGSAELVRADLSTATGLEQLVAQVGQLTDHLDQVVHGAVLAHSSSTMEVDPETFSRALWLNGAILLPLVQGLRPLFGPGSSVFFLSSRGADHVVPGYVAVGAPKALAESLVRYLAVELAPAGIRALTLVVSAVRTDAVLQVLPNAEERLAAMAARNPAGRNLGPADVAAALHRLASEELPMLTGHRVVLDGGSHLLT